MRRMLLLTEHDVRVEAALGSCSAEVFNGAAFVGMQLSRMISWAREDYSANSRMFKSLMKRVRVAEVYCRAFVVSSVLLEGRE